MILFVCVGNLCRSPLAEALVRSAITAVGCPLQVQSAGTQAQVHAGPDPLTAAIARAYGASTTDHRPTQLTQQHMQDAGLVLTATRDVRRTAVRLHPPAIKYTFTIRQFARTLANAGESFTPGDFAPDELLGALRTFAVEHRGMSAPVDADRDDVIDPYGGSRSVHDTAARQLLPALNEIVRALRGQPLVNVPDTFDRRTNVRSMHA